MQMLQQQQQPPPQPPLVQVSSPSPDETLRARAASPTGAQKPRANGSVHAMTMSSPQQQQEPNGFRQSTAPSQLQSIKTAKGPVPGNNFSKPSSPPAGPSSPPQRPRREDDPAPLNGSVRASNRATSPTPASNQMQSRGLVGAFNQGPVQQQQPGGQEPVANRAMSPTAANRPKAAPPLVVANGPSGSPQNSPPSTYSSQFPSGIASARAHLARSPSPNRPNGSASSHDGLEYSQSHEDGFYYGPKAAFNGDEGKTQKWLRSALSLAAQKGFLLPQPGEGNRDDEVAKSSVEGVETVAAAKDHHKVLEALVLLKQELAKARVRVGSVM
jgi:hypothetical protein